MQFVDALAAACGSAALLNMRRHRRGALPISATVALASAAVLLTRHPAARHRARPRSEVILAVGAHPDDLELACGGTLARYAEDGAEVHGLVMNDGSRGGDSRKRLREADEGARVMGLTSITVLDHPDTSLSEDADAMVRDVEEAIARLQPTMIFTHSANDNHQDHVAVHLAVVRAARQHPSILCFESPSATRAFAPSVFVDIAGQVSAKEAAVQTHRDQSGKPYMTAHRVRGLAAFRGSQARTAYAEGFELVRMQMPGSAALQLGGAAAPRLERRAS